MNALALRLDRSVLISPDFASPSAHDLLDTSAILTLRNDEAGADRVAEVLGLAISGKAKRYGCFMTHMEVYYRVWRDEELRLFCGCLHGTSASSVTILLHTGAEL